MSKEETYIPVPNSLLHLVRLALGLNYFHFGYLKFFPDLSPAEIIASYTAQRLSLYWLDAHTTLLIIAILECVIGFAFLFNIGLRWIAPLFFFHMAATFLPLFLLPEVSFKFAPVAPTLEGQYILKNFVLVTAGILVLYPHLKSFSFRKKTPGAANDSAPDVPAPVSAETQS